ncbi:MAG: pitrilysin family protein [Lentimicrobiaceae bacterium]|jgi:predicted Zn-dependent peptidase
MAYQYFELKNGIRLVHRQQCGSVAHLGVVVNAGSRDESPDQQGLAHFIEHLIFKGTQKRSNYQVLSRLENVGADLNAFTTKEDTSVYASIQVRYYQRAAELLADILFQSSFPEKEIEKEKAVVMDEINSYMDNPAEWIHDEFDELVFGDHPLGRNILGTKQKLKKYTRKDVLRFRDANYIPSRVVITSVANINFSKAIAVAEKYFGGVATDITPIQRKPFSGYIPQTLIRKYSRHQAHVIIGNTACDVYDERRFAMSLLNNILGGPAMNSRLNISLRERNGIAYNLESNYQPFSDTGLFSIYCGTDENLMPRAMELIHKELYKFRNVSLTTVGLHTAKLQLKGQLAISLESHQNEMLAIGKNLLVYGKVDPVEEIYRKIDNVTATGLLDLANEVFDPSCLSTLIFNNQKQASR